MGRNWSRRKASDQAKAEMVEKHRLAVALAPTPEMAPTKEELRHQAAAAMANYTGPIKRLPTYAALRCRTCGHRGTAVVPQGAEPRFKCSACGSSLVAWTV